MAYPRTLEVCFDISTTRRALTTVANALATNRKGVTSLHLATTDTEDLSMVQSLHNAGGAVAKTIRELTIATPLGEVERRVGFDKSNGLVAVTR
ncbi:hypothetical protein N7497_012023 [Penicillium chrysogenum]|uniref:Uncharacterized protein n=1 Tax=Penicillium chrysogenum TaxID=5076 RepID=A0ABQ8WT47_PENCH|nr:hypothetical protein N7505_000189 [Penicillium chrysogenum]KAJ6141130.1 hypothetical protein N7497_012023 [Penicillium chrysogenum]